MRRGSQYACLLLGVGFFIVFVWSRKAETLVMSNVWLAASVVIGNIPKNEHK